MPYEKQAARCAECYDGKVDSDEDQFLMGTNECPDCGCEDFEILELDESEDSSKATNN